MLFIFGVPRSGTSWLSKIIDSHPDVVFRHEPDSVRRNTDLPAFCLQADIPRYLEQAKTYLEEMKSTRTSKVVGSLPFFSKSYQNMPLRELRRAMILGTKAGERIGPLKNILRNLSIPDFITDKDNRPFAIKSIDALGRAGLFMAAAPDAKAIHVIRHPCGHIASVLRGIENRKFDDDVPITEDMGVYENLATITEATERGLTFTAFQNMHALERLAWRWALANEKAMNDLDASGRSLTIAYEALCEEPEAKAKELFRFADLSWNKQSEDFIKASTGHSGSETFYQVFRDPKKSAYKWKEQLTREEIEMILAVAKQTRPGKLF